MGIWKMGGGVCKMPWPRKIFQNQHIFYIKNLYFKTTWIPKRAGQKISKPVLIQLYQRSLSCCSNPIEMNGSCSRAQSASVLHFKQFPSFFLTPVNSIHSISLYHSSSIACSNRQWENLPYAQKPWKYTPGMTHFAFPSHTAENLEWSLGACASTVLVYPHLIPHIRLPRRGGNRSHLVHTNKLEAINIANM